VNRGGLKMALRHGTEARHRGCPLRGRSERGWRVGLRRGRRLGSRDSQRSCTNRKQPLFWGDFFWLSRFFLQLFKARKREAELDFWEPGKRSWGGAKFTDFSKKMEGIPAKVDESASTKYCVDKALGVDILGSHLIRQGEGTFIGWRSSRRQF